MTLRLTLLALASCGAAAFHVTTGTQPVTVIHLPILLNHPCAPSPAGLPRSSAVRAQSSGPQMKLRSGAGSVLAASLALVLSTATPNFVSADVTPPAVVRSSRTPACTGSGLGLVVLRRDPASRTIRLGRVWLRSQVQQYGASMVADEEMRDAQAKFLAERAVR